MTVQELINQLSRFDRSLTVVGYNGNTEDDFMISEVLTASTDEAGLIGFYNQGASCMEGMPEQSVVVIC